MLKHIYIRDFAIIREIDIDLMDKLNIITGETGTGKSIIIQAIDIALGGRGGSYLVAEWADKAIVQLIFTIDEQECLEISKYVSEPEDHEIIISREIYKNGKSIARINGEIVNLTILRKITSMLIDIHGQYDNQILLDPTNHINIIDDFAGENIYIVKKELDSIYEDYSKTLNALKKIRSDHNELLRRSDLMKYEMTEIENATPVPGEDIELSEKLNILQNAEKIAKNLNECYNILYSAELGKCTSLLSSISEYDTKYSKYEESINGCIYVIDDLCSEIRRSIEETNFTPGEIDSIVERLEVLDKLKRKYGGSIEKVIEYKEKCSLQLEKFDNSEELEKEISTKLSQLKEMLLKKSSELSELRRSAGIELSKKMTEELHDLNFSNAVFSVDISEKTNPNGEPELSSNGKDNIKFLFNANKGGSMKPLAEIASGGEISRISLAFKKITNDIEHVRVMIFDEIDTGISGVTASVVGKKLHNISHDNQILCITHLPQIAAAGDQQYLISKDDSESHSYTTIKLLDPDERINELARLLGGTTITETTLASAKELIEASHK